MSRLTQGKTKEIKMLLTTKEAVERFNTGNYEVIRQRSFGGSTGSFYLKDKQNNAWHSLRRSIGKQLFETKEVEI